MNILFWWIVAVLVVVVLPVTIIYICAIFCNLYDKLFNKEQKHLEKIYKEFDKLFDGRSCFRRISDLKDEDYEKHHNDPKYVRYCMTEFAVRYVDPETLNYNETYMQEWENMVNV